MKDVILDCALKSWRGKLHLKHDRGNPLCMSYIPVSLSLVISEMQHAYIPVVTYGEKDVNFSLAEEYEARPAVLFLHQIYYPRAPTI